jgi:hypothetical protein
MNCRNGARWPLAEMANEQNIKVDDARNVAAVSLRWVEMDSLR